MLPFEFTIKGPSVPGQSKNCIRLRQWKADGRSQPPRFTALACAEMLRPAFLVFLVVFSAGISSCSNEQMPSNKETDVSISPVDNAPQADAQNPRIQRSSPTSDTSLTFHGYECTQDCSGHEAGYQWAQEHDIDDPDNCGGNSESFIEGCRAYAEEQGESTESKDSEE